MFMVLLASPAFAQYRPLSMGDIVDAVGSTPEGMPPDDLGERISTYAYFTSDDQGVGLAVRFASDPDGAIFAAWRFRGELWRYGWIEDSSLGRLDTIKPAGRGFVIDTRHPDGTGTAAVLRPDMGLLAAVPGIPRLALDSGAVVLQQASSLAYFDPAANLATNFFTPSASVAPVYGAFEHDARAGTLTFEQRVGSAVTTVRCTSLSTAQRKCGGP